MPSGPNGACALTRMSAYSLLRATHAGAGLTGAAFAAADFVAAGCAAGCAACAGGAPVARVRARAMARVSGLVMASAVVGTRAAWRVEGSGTMRRRSFPLIAVALAVALAVA